MKNFIVITSINELTEAIKLFAKRKNWHVIVVGDKKSPPLNKNPKENIIFLSVDEQKNLGFKSYETCPFNHYARKNLGYLYAIQQGAETIADTDDDNFPYKNWGEDIPNTPKTLIKTISGPKFINIYKHFTKEFIWPRGLPLDTIQDNSNLKINKATNELIAVWQRLIINKFVTFDKHDPIALKEGHYCPFNTQNTIWKIKDFFPYLYIPISVSFRFCDILKSYIAQRGFWAMGAKLAFTSASVYQDRNVHNFMKDFLDEIPCYKDVKKVVELLDTLELQGNPKKDVIKIYKELKNINVVDQSDVNGIQNFVSDITNF